MSLVVRRSSLISLLISVLAFASGCSPANTESSSQAETQPDPIQVAPNVTLAGPIDGFVEAELRDSDTLVIDLRMAEEEGTTEEALRLSTAGIRHLQFPMGREVPTREQVGRFEDVLSENSDRPILIHCSSGNRAGLLWGAHLIEQGMEIEEALAKVRLIANREPTAQAIRSYVKGGE